MGFIEFEPSERLKEWSMSNMHSHSHYEVYFLLKGTRRFFIKNKLYTIKAPCVTVIPPYTAHRTEGEGFMRININLSPDVLNGYQTEALKKFSNGITPLSAEEVKTVYPVLEAGVSVAKDRNPYYYEMATAIFSYLVFLLDSFTVKDKIVPISGNSEDTPPVVLSIIKYLSENCEREITLSDLKDRFFLSKASICFNFKKAMGCTVNEYLTELRLNKAKKYLETSHKGIEEISYLCGFSSAAYMGYVFKKKTGLSPLNYRKVQTTKT